MSCSISWALHRFRALSGGVIPSWLAIIGITLLTTIVSLYGYRYVHRYERYAWIPMVLIFLAIAITNAPQAAIVTAKSSGIVCVSSLLSFGGVIYGAAGWAPYAADYTVKQPETTLHLEFLD